MVCPVPQRRAHDNRDKRVGEDPGAAALESSDAAGRGFVEHRDHALARPGAASLVCTVRESRRGIERDRWVRDKDVRSRSERRLSMPVSWRAPSVAAPRADDCRHNAIANSLGYQEPSWHDCIAVRNAGVDRVRQPRPYRGASWFGPSRAVAAGRDDHAARWRGRRRERGRSWRRGRGGRRCG